MLFKQFQTKKQLRGCVSDPHATLWVSWEDVHLRITIISCKHFVLCGLKTGYILYNLCLSRDKGLQKETLHPQYDDKFLFAISPDVTRNIG